MEKIGYTRQTQKLIYWLLDDFANFWQGNEAGARPSFIELAYTKEVLKSEFVKVYNGFVAFCLGNVLKYLIRAEKKNGKEDYKKAAKYLEWVIENYDIEDEFVEYGIYAIEDEFNIKWNEIISEIAKDLKIKEAFKLDAIFRDVLSENYETAKKILDDFIKEYEVA